MKIKIIKAIITITPVENYLKEVKKEFVFDSSYFEKCETIEEIRDMFYEGLNDNYIVEYTEIYTYKTKKDYEKNKQYEYIGE